MTNLIISCTPINLTEPIKNSILLTKGSIFLDSSYLNHSDSHYSIIAFDPYSTISIHNGIIEESFRNGASNILHKDPIDYLDKLLKKYKHNKSIPESPVIGGLFGSFSYEFGQYIQDYRTLLKSGNFPDFIGGLYDKLIVIDHKKEKTFYIHSTLFEDQIINFELPNVKEIHSFVSEGVEDLVSKKEYQSIVSDIKDFIFKGDIYQANFSIPFKATYSGDLLAFYLNLRHFSKAPYSAYLNFDSYHILSSSPELFFNIKGADILTRPIKGTEPRGLTPLDDSKQKLNLLHSEKDIAELTMITDLERNDLRKVCKPNTVTVDTLREIETFPQVFHGVSTISGQLTDNWTISTLLNALFPGGSITGAPKIRAMEIINHFEHHKRGPYTGSIGFFDFNGSSQFNIAIRTAYSIKNNIYFHAGGGIVADSEPEKEWEEIKAKSKGIQDTFSRLKPIISS
tara:strand:- start:723 stop:2087 length:1365 start_codon:yes stop_codon:yes gene_type:complete